MKDKKNAIEHLREHQDFPATKIELVAACDNMSDFSAEDKKWFEKNLPAGTYNSAEEVMQAIGISEQVSPAM